jgi:hypothetical protein
VAGASDDNIGANPALAARVADRLGEVGVLADPAPGIEPVTDTKSEMGRSDTLGPSRFSFGLDDFRTIIGKLELIIKFVFVVGYEYQRFVQWRV